MGWEWRCFFVPRDDAQNALACAGKPEERTDLYLPVSAACGVKARGGSSEGTLEVKIRDGVADDGFERWSKEGVKASELARVLELAGHAQVGLLGLGGVVIERAPALQQLLRQLLEASGPLEQILEEISTAVKKYTRVLDFVHADKVGASGGGSSSKMTARGPNAPK